MSFVRSVSRPSLSGATLDHAAHDRHGGLVRLHVRLERGRQPRGVPRHGTERRHERGVVAATLPADVE